uniref:Uncharacterized protein n=1 Tax=Rhizophora mucronata TaxID=61149 RepID=A0A2P2NVT6_RHIMU
MGSCSFISSMILRWLLNNWEMKMKPPLDLAS